MRGLTLLTVLLNGELKSNSSVPIPWTTEPVGHMASSFWEIALIWPVFAMLLKGTGLEVPGKWICSLAFVHVPDELKPVHRAPRSPVRNAALGTKLPALMVLPWERIPW